MPTTNATPRMSNGEARIARIRAEDPRTVDALSALSAATYRTASGNSSKRLAQALGSSDSRARHQWNEGTGDLLNISLLIVRLHGIPHTNPGAVVAHVKSTHAHAKLPMTTDELVRRFNELCDEEAEAEGCENKTLTRFQRGEMTAEEMEAADLAEAGIQEERAAVLRELRRRGVDPRTWRSA